MASKIQQIVVTNDTPGNDEFGLVVRPIGGTGGGDVTIVDPIGQKPMDESVSVVIASDQTPIPVTVSGASSVTASATLTNNGETLDINTEGMGALLIQITATTLGWDGHLNFTMSVDGVQFDGIAIPGQNSDSVVGPYVPRFFMDSFDKFIRANVAGIKTFRLTVSNRTVGTVTVKMLAVTVALDNLVSSVIVGAIGNSAVVTGQGAFLTVPVDQSGNNLARDPGTSADRAVAVQGVTGGVPVAVSATNLDIRDLTFAADKVDVSGSSVSVSNFPATQPVSGTVAVSNFPAIQPVSATDLDIRNLVFATDKVDVSGSAVTAVVTATDLDIRNLTFAQDKVDASGSSVTSLETANVYANDADSGYNASANPASHAAANLTQDQYGNLRVVDYDTQMKMLVALEEIGQQLELTNDLLSRMVSFSGRNSLNTSAKQGTRLPRRIN